MEGLRDETLAAISRAETSDALEEVRIGVLGKKGSLTTVLRSMRDVPKEERPIVGKLSNEVRDVIEAALDERKTLLKASELDAQLAAGAVDITLPGRCMPIGSEHLINRIIRECTDIFAGIGYEVEGGREIETDWYNFTALNAPKDHPSRTLQDNFNIVDMSGDQSPVERS